MWTHYAVHTAPKKMNEMTLYTYHGLCMRRPFSNPYCKFQLHLNTSAVETKVHIESSQSIPNNTKLTLDYIWHHLLSPLHKEIHGPLGMKMTTQHVWKDTYYEQATLNMEHLIQ